MYRATRATAARGNVILGNLRIAFRGLRPWLFRGTLVLVVIGAYYLLTNLGFLNWLKGDVLWPTLLILLGVALLVRRGRSGWF